MFVYLEVQPVAQDIVTYSVNKKELFLGIGQQEQLIVTETTEKVDGTTIEKDITPQTNFNVVNNKVAKVNKGLVTAHQAGKTQVRVMIPGEETIFVYVEVKELPQDIVSYEVNQTNMKLAVGEQKQLKVTEKTVKPDGQIVEKDVTVSTSFQVVNNSIAKVNKGLVTGHKVGKTQVMVMVPNEETTLVYLTVEGATEEVVPEPETQKFSVSDQDIAGYVNDKKAKAILIKVPAYENELAVEFTKEILQTIQDAKKDLVIKSGEATFSLEKSDVKKLVKEAGGDVTITLGQSDSGTVEEAISDTYRIVIEAGLGEDKQSLEKFKAKMDITLPIDETKLKNGKKVAVHEPNAKKPLKAKYKKGILEFSVKETGSFTVINN